MSDVLLLYLFTRLDALGVALGLLEVLSLIWAVVLFIMAMNYRNASADRYHVSETKESAARKNELAPTLLVWAKRMGFAFALVLVGDVVLPKKNDMAIIVGGKIALDVSRSDTAKEIGAEVLDAIRAQLKKAAQ